MGTHQERELRLENTDTGRTQKLLEQMIFDGHEVRVIEKFGGPPETRTPEPVIKSRATPRTTAYMRRQDPSVPSVRYPTSSVLNEVHRLQHTDKRRTLATGIPAGGLIHNQQGRKKCFGCKGFPLGC